MKTLKANNWLLNMVVDGLKKTDSPLASMICPLKKGPYIISNWIIDDDLIPNTIKLLGMWRTKRIFRVNLKAFTKLPNIPQSKPFINYNLDGEVKIKKN